MIEEDGGAPETGVDHVTEGGKTRTRTSLKEAYQRVCL